MLSAHRTLKHLLKPRCLTCLQKLYKHCLPELPYPLGGLEPVICQEIVDLHYNKHHAVYVKNLNCVEENLKKALCNGDINTAIGLMPAYRFYGGGHLNHCLFWKSFTPSCTKPNDMFAKAVCDCFGSFDEMKNRLLTMTNGVKGSGWGWLGYNPQTSKLQMAVTSNEDPLWPSTGLIPILGLDAWEHAYYLQYRNCRSEYTNRIYDIIDWCEISDRYIDATCFK